jgi:hypothetical protein
MSSSISATCPHGLRPGTNVCLRCKYDERAANRKRRYMVAARVGIAASGVVVAISVLIGVVMAIAPTARTSSATEANDDGTVVQASKPRPAPAAERVTPKAAARVSTAKLEPRIAEGRRELTDSMFAVREGEQVTVHFDTEELRTRYDWKFERVVRSTLPIVFGAAVRAALDSIPEGQFATGGDLLTELTTRGIDLTISEGQTLRVWPVTRPGQDGPLVVAYRATSAP